MSADPGPDEVLKRTSALLRESDTVAAAAKQLSELLEKRNWDEAAHSATRLCDELVPATRPVKTAHRRRRRALKDTEIQVLWDLSLDDLVKGAIREGRLRERRMILQAKEAKTNRLLALAAFTAAVVALLTPFIAWLLDAP